MTDFKIAEWQAKYKDVQWEVDSLRAQVKAQDVKLANAEMVLSQIGELLRERSRPGLKADDVLSAVHGAFRRWRPSPWEDQILGSAKNTFIRKAEGGGHYD